MSFLNTKNVTSRGFNFDNCQFISAYRDDVLRKGKLRRHDIVLTTRGTVGNTAHYGMGVPFENIRINSGMVLLRILDDGLLPNILSSSSLLMALGKQVERLQSGTAQPQLPILTLKKVKLPLPPLETQLKFNENRKSLEELQVSFKDSLRQSESLFSSLINNRAFKGEL